MRRLTMTGAALGIALLIAGPAPAQAPAVAANPNDTVPEGMHAPQYGMPVSPDQARQVVAAAFAEARRRNWNGLCIAIVGPAGDLMHFDRQENCQYASVDIAQGKARTAARFRRPTLVFERLMAQGDVFAFLPTLGGLNAARGGVPLLLGGRVVGAIGVSGGTGSQDDVVAMAGAAALN